MSAPVEWAARQRWFRSKSRTVVGGAVEDSVALGDAELLALRVDFASGEPETYALTMRGEDDAAAQVSGALVDWIAEEKVRDGLRARRGSAFAETFAGEVPPPRLLSAEQSNSAVRFGDRAIAKIYRRLESGENPEVEILRALAERDVPVPRWIGSVEWRGRALLLLQAFVPNRGDAWSLARAGDPAELGRAARLGARTAELHRALAHAFGVERLPDRRAEVRRQARVAVSADPRLSSRAAELDARIMAAELTVGAPTTRVHGDYHLGQVLVTPSDDFVILDFEGEPARSLDERRAKSSPFKDVAGMLRSYAYAGRADTSWTDRVSRAFLDAWLAGVAGSEIAPRDRDEERALLDLFVLEKALYEIEYERNNRPDWLAIPVEGVLAILDRRPVH